MVEDPVGVNGALVDYGVDVAVVVVELCYFGDEDEAFLEERVLRVWWG